MEESISDMEREIVFYDPSLFGFEAIVDDLYSTMQAQNTIWFRMDKTDVTKVMTALLSHYSAINNARYYARRGYFIDWMKEEMYTRYCGIPRFIRDFLREFCRPMQTNLEVWIPYIQIPNYESKLCDIHGANAELHNKFRMSCEKLKFEMVPILREDCKAHPLMFYDQSTSQIFEYQRNPEWRLEAFNYTRHLTRYGDGKTCQEEPKSAIKQCTHNRNYPLSLQDDQVTNLLVSEIQGRYIGVVPFFCHSVREEIDRYGLILFQRFPSEEAHSNTPPKRSVKLKKEARSKPKDKPPLEAS